MALGRLHSFHSVYSVQSYNRPVKIIPFVVVVPNALAH